MMHRGHRDGRGINTTRKVGDGRESLAAKLASNGLRLRWVTINHGHQFHALILFFKFVVNARMIAAERTHTNDCYTDCTLVSQANDFLRPSRSEQSLRSQNQNITANER
jgi:hypothetical protein